MMIMSLKYHLINCKESKDVLKMTMVIIQLIEIFCEYDRLYQ